MAIAARLLWVRGELRLLETEQRTMEQKGHCGGGYH
jgi:hypothetical protein